MKPLITVVSLGTGDPDLLNMKTIRILRDADSLVIRTEKHPIVSWLIENGIRYSTLDFLYEQFEDFDLLNHGILDYLIRLTDSGPLVYAVPDAATDRTVYTLLHEKPDSIEVEVLPGVSLYDIHLTQVLSFLHDTAVTVVPASMLSDTLRYDPNTTLLVTELDNTILAGDVKLFLSDMLGDEFTVCLLHAGKKPLTIPLYELDRQTGIDHCSAVLVPGSGILKRSRFSFSDLETLMETLRSPSGCPWDRLQTHDSLRSYLIEEAWECIACIDQHDPYHLCEELGDLLFQVFFHSSIGRSYGEFTINDVISGICTKMIHRHPHVFGGVEQMDADSIRSAWEHLKQEETGNTTVLSSLDDVSPGLPSLKYAAKVMKKLSITQAIRSDPAPVLDDIRKLTSFLIEGAGSVSEEHLSRLLYLCAELCFISGYDSELILHQTVDCFKNRLKRIEKAVISDGKSLEHLTFEELSVYLKHAEDENI